MTVSVQPSLQDLVAALEASIEDKLRDFNEATGLVVHRLYLGYEPHRTREKVEQLHIQGGQYGQPVEHVVNLTQGTPAPFTVEAHVSTHYPRPRKVNHAGY